MIFIKLLVNYKSLVKRIKFSKIKVLIAKYFMFFNVQLACDVR